VRLRSEQLLVLLQPKVQKKMYNMFMSQGQTVISLLLIIIIYFLYHITRQLSYLTGKRLKISFMNWQTPQFKFPKPHPKKQNPNPPKNLPN
jgi:hypothetical protein